ncbi:MAG: pyrimidine reductase family protein [Actinomycetia bacterium]|nr:pyrimidine reductase family protein [Actinomycetes bacterium]
MERLLPGPHVTMTPQRDVDALASHYAYPDAGALRSNMVASIDGAISLDGRSKPISGESDWFLFGLQRALADVIVVGAGTARAEGYGPGRTRPEFAHLRNAAGQPSAPTLAIVTASGKLDPAANCFTGTARTTVITCRAAPAVHVDPLRAVADVIVSGGETVDLRGAIDVLRERGLRRILTEGGPSLLGALTSHDLIDELVASISPSLIGGDAPRMVVGAPETLRRLELVGVLEDEGTLFIHYRRARGAT